MPSRARKKPPPKRAKRSLLARRQLSIPRLQLEPHHLDIAALALVACGIFLAGVAYLHWSGGALGSNAVLAMRFVLGALGYAVPAAMLVGGGLILARELRPPGRPMRTGTLCLIAALTLILAAGTLGIGPGMARGHEFWQPHAFESRGGAVGQAELWLASHLISTLGAQILSIFLLIAGLLLVSGATVAGVIRMTGEGVAESSRALRRTTLDGRQGLRGLATRHPADRASAAAAEEAARESAAALDELVPPEPDTAELVVRATHVEAPPIEPQDDEPVQADEDEARAGRTEAEAVIARFWVAGPGTAT